MRSAILLAVCVVVLWGGVAVAPPAAEVGKPVEHRVKHITNVPGFEGQEFELGIRERSPAKPNGQAVMFVHGLTLPGGPVFDLDHKDYSWMAAVAARGFRAFSVDMTGYGASTRPAPMSVPKNLLGLDRLVLKLPPGERPCPYQLTSFDSDLHDMDTAVEFVRTTAKVDRVHLVGTSLGGGRVLVYASKFPEKVGRVVVQGWGLANPVDDKPEKLPPPGAPVTVTSEGGLATQWKFMTKRPGQVEPGMFEMVWKALQATDPDGAKWGPGCVRSPGIALWGWNKAVMSGVKAPVLLVFGEYDPLAPPGTALHDKLATPEKLNLTQKGVSHVPYWEAGHEHLYAASVEWLESGTVNGRKTGIGTLHIDGKYEWK